MTMETEKKKSPPQYWSAYTAWLVANLVLLIICLPLLVGIGYARGWNTNLSTGKFEFHTVKDARRFWSEPNDHEENKELDASIPGRDFEAAAGSWYYWKYRPSGTDNVCIPGDFDPVTEPHTLSCDVPEANSGTRAFVWICYLVHQCLIWGITYKAQREHANNTQYHRGLRWYNMWSLIVNCAGYLMHLVQTHVTYDGTAQDVTEASSQASVIMLLVMVLLMEYKNRGLFLGWPANASPKSAWWHFPTPPMELIRKYHGYAFSWATIYTLWYHPMEPTVGHVLGFLHTGILLIQQSLMFTPLHVSKYWKLLLECWVTIHGGIVAIQTISGGQWAMFLFGFLWMFVFTQIHGIPYYLGFAKVAQRERAKRLAAKEEEVAGGEVPDVSVPSEHEQPIPYGAYIPTAQWKRWLIRLFPVVLYFVIVVSSYATVLKKPDQTSIGLGWIGEIVRIPGILYLLALFTIVIAWGMMASQMWLCRSKSTDETTTNEGGYFKGKAEAERSSEEGQLPAAADLDEVREPQSIKNTTAEVDEEAAVKSTTASRLKNISTATVLAIFFVCYTIMVVLSIIIESIHVQMNLITLMILCVAIFTVLSLFAMIFQEQELDRIGLGGPQIPPECTERNQEPAMDPPTKELGESTEFHSATRAFSIYKGATD